MQWFTIRLWISLMGWWLFDGPLVASSLSSSSPSTSPSTSSIQQQVFCYWITIHRRSSIFKCVQDQFLMHVIDMYLVIVFAFRICIDVTVDYCWTTQRVIQNVQGSSFQISCFGSQNLQKILGSNLRSIYQNHEKKIDLLQYRSYCNHHHRTF